MSAAPLPASPDVQVDSDQRVWNGRFPLHLVRFRQRRFDGTLSDTRTWELWRRGRAAALLPYDPVRDTVILVEQFRLPALAAGLDPVLVELPAGLCDGAEPAQQTVRREALEETGITPDRLERIGEFILSAGGSDEVCTLFAGRIQTPVAGTDGIIGHHGSPAEHEDIRVRVWSASSAIDAALAGRIPNSIATLGLLWLYARRDALRAQWMES